MILVDVEVLQLLRLHRSAEIVLIVAQRDTTERFSLVLWMPQKGVAFRVLGWAFPSWSLGLTYLFFFKERDFVLGMSYHSASLVFFKLRRFFMYQGFLASFMPV